MIEREKPVVAPEPNAAHTRAFAELERAVYAALETYSNVHRGAGHHSMVSTALYERAREIVLEHLGLDAARHVVAFCSGWRAAELEAQLEPGSYHALSSRDIGLPLGLTALAVRRSALPKGTPIQTGGDVVDLVAHGYVVWADAPRRFEAGTPSIVNAITLAKALTVIRRLGSECFAGGDGSSTAAEILHRDEFSGACGKELLLALRGALVGRDVRVPTAKGERLYINLDNGASTPTFDPIWETVRQTWRQPERVRREIVRQVREICAEFLGAPLAEYDIVFTCNTTEALNLAAQSLEVEHANGAEPVVLNTQLEHHSNELPWRYVPGVSLVRLHVDGDGFVDLGELERVLRAHNQEHAHGAKRVCIVAVSGASNVLGSFNDLQAIGRVVHRYGARFLVDGAQLVAHRSVDMIEAGIDYLAFSGHKLYAPFGSGALVVRRGLLNCQPAELARIKASGEENVVGIAALGKAITLLQRVGMDVLEEMERSLTRRTLRGLSRIPGIKVFGVPDPDAPRFHRRGGTIVFSAKRVPHNLVAKELGEKVGIGVRNGCFCAHSIVRELLNIHPVRTFIGALGLRLFPGYFLPILPGAVRVSLGLENNARHVDALIQTLEEIASAPRTRIDRFVALIHNGTPSLPHTEAENRIKDFVSARAERVFAFSS